MATCDEPYVKWIAEVFGECVNTTRQKASFGIGMTAMVFGVYTTVPQVFLNFKLHSAEGLSFGFVLFLLMGDLCNAIGVLVTHGLPTQLISASWYVLIDIVCLWQYIYYVWLRPKCCPVSPANGYEEIPGAPLVPLFVAGASAASQCQPYDRSCIAGTLLGWVSAASYMGSRLPQIIYNFKRKKTDGLSIQMFICAMLQNLCYASSIFLYDSHWSSIWLQFPWLVGSLGLIFFDFTVLGQFLYCGTDKKADDASTLMTAETD
jgi:uncharacterized protein with PQ loop repeat